MARASAIHQRRDTTLSLGVASTAASSSAPAVLVNQRRPLPGRQRRRGGLTPVRAPREAPSSSASTRSQVVNVIRPVSAARPLVGVRLCRAPRLTLVEDALAAEAPPRRRAGRTASAPDAPLRSFRGDMAEFRRSRRSRASGGGGGTALLLIGVKFGRSPGPDGDGDNGGSVILEVDRRRPACHRSYQRADRNAASTTSARKDGQGHRHRFPITVVVIGRLLANLAGRGRALPSRQRGRGGPGRRRSPPGARPPGFLLGGGQARRRPRT